MDWISITDRWLDEVQRPYFDKIDPSVLTPYVRAHLRKSCTTREQYIDRVLAYFEIERVPGDGL